MLVTPIASTAIGNVDVAPAHSPSSVERAKAAFAGTTISPSDTPEDEFIAKKRQSIRSLKMKTQASPERYMQEIAAAQPELNAISDTGEQTNATPEEMKPLSPQFAALARQRRALQVKERELLAKEQAMTSDGQGNGHTEVFARLKAEPLSVLREAGVTYDDLTNAILNQSSVNPEIETLKNEIKSLKEGIDKNFADRETQSEQQVLTEMRKEALSLATQGDEYELIRNQNGIKHVMSLIERTYRATGEVLEVSEAMNLVESELLKDAMKVANMNKIKKSFLPQPQVQPQQQSQPVMRTLTNRDTAIPPLSRTARAIAAFNGTLKR